MDISNGAEVQASRALGVLGALAKVPQATVKELSVATRIPVSTIYRLLVPLVASGFVHKTTTRHYGAGPIAVQLSERYRDATLTTGSVTPLLRQLAQDTGELAAFMVVHGTEAVCVDAVESQHTLRCSYTVGASQPLLRGATATALLSHLTAKRRAEIFDYYDVQSGERIERELACERSLSDGYAVSLGALDDGIWGVSVAVADGSGALRGAVTLMAPAHRSTHRSQQLIGFVRRVSEALSGGLR